MKIAGICFTENGFRLMSTLDAFFRSGEKYKNAGLMWFGKGNFMKENVMKENVMKESSMKDSSMKESVSAMNVREAKESLNEWTEKYFSEADVIIFVSSAGIAVRSIAPFIRSKYTDPAVLVIDEKGKFCISLLSGHFGGANRLAEDISKGTGSIPVITTATDLNGIFAVDAYAAEHGLVMAGDSCRQYAKEISAKLLSGKNVGFYTSYPVSGKLPEGLVPLMDHSYMFDNAPTGSRADETEEELSANGISRGELGFVIGVDRGRDYFRKTLWLVPPVITIGIGCKKNTPAEAIEDVFHDYFSENGLFTQAVTSAATIDLKKDEAGILEFCRNHKIHLTTYSAEELNLVKGDFSGSDFVRRITGVDNVCERAAVLKSGGKLIARKKGKNGVTIAAASSDWRVVF